MDGRAARRYQRAEGDDIAEAMSQCDEAVEHLQQQLTAVAARKRRHESALAELYGTPPAAAVSESSAQTTLDVKKPRLTSVRSVGTQTD